MEIRENIDTINANIENAAAKSRQLRSDITLVAVSKTQPVERVSEAAEFGLRVFGENKVQELVDKYNAVKDIEWHFIGHLQKNKVKYIIDKVKLIHSLDSIELAEEINKRAAAINVVMPVLVQINIGREQSKSGIYEEELNEFCTKISLFPNILVSGIMAIPPAAEDPEDSRIYFRRMRELYKQIRELEFDNFNIRYLSMGMTNDYQIAIEEGANIVRVGTGIFGERNYIRGDNNAK